MDELDPTLSGSGEAEAPKSKLPLIAVVVGALGLVVGFVGITSAGKAKDEVAALRAEINERADRTQELVDKFNDVDSRLVTLGNELVRLNKQDLALRDMTQQALNEMSAKLASGGKAKAAPAPAADGEKASGSSDAPADGQYVIKAGDTFAKIAKELGVSVDAIVSANPGVKPTSLKIGQKINVPKGN